MLNLDSAPANGRVLAYADDRLVYDGYEVLDGTVVLRSGGTLDLGDVYELHLFDDAKEYRALFEGGEWVERVLRSSDEFDDIDHFVFSERQFLQERFWVDESGERIVVHNRFSFDEEGSLRLDGYRLAMDGRADR